MSATAAPNLETAEPETVTPSATPSATAAPVPSATVTPSAPTTPAPTASATPRPSATATATGDVFSGKRQVRLALVERPGSYVTVGKAGRATVTKTTDASSLFVLTRRGSDVVISTAPARAGGEQACLTAKDVNSTMPIILAALPCTQDRRQLFAFTAMGRRQGRTVYALSDDSAGYVQWSSDPAFALYVQELGDAELETTFTVEDQGEVEAVG